MAYHLKKIKKGVKGEVSKIREELEELEDAIEQGNTIEALVELSDIVGAIDLFLKAHHPSVTLKDVVKMARVTESAFEDGTRK